eukprot:13369173-Alexandrium_andersonii.AAC.1
MPLARSPARFVSRFGICANHGAERTLPELRGPILRRFLGPRSSRFERLEQFSHFASNAGAARLDRLDSLLHRSEHLDGHFDLWPK